MAKTAPFQKHADRYEKWFETNYRVYEAELKAVKSLFPEAQCSLEIGVGTGRFAAPLGVTAGLEPSSSMREFAQKRGIITLGGVAEQLPFRDAAFELVFMVTTVCFLDSIEQAFQESYRVLSKGGYLLIGLLDRNSPLGQSYLKGQKNSLFYHEATFCSVDDVLSIMKKTLFHDFSFRQTIFRNLSEVTKNELVKAGYGEGSFVVIRGRKK